MKRTFVATAALLVALVFAPGVAQAGGSIVVAPNAACEIEPDYCDDFDVSYDDTCDEVTVTITNHYGSDVVFTIAQTAGATYPLTNLTVLNGQTNSAVIEITSAIHEIGLYLHGVDEYIDKYQLKGLGNCATPTPSTSSPDTTPTGTSGPELPVTGNDQSLILGMAFVLTVLGAGIVFAVRRTRP